MPFSRLKLATPGSTLWSLFVHAECYWQITDRLLRGIQHGLIILFSFTLAYFDGKHSLSALILYCKLLRSWPSQGLINGCGVVSSSRQNRSCFCDSKTSHWQVLQTSYFFLSVSRKLSIASMISSSLQSLAYAVAYITFGVGLSTVFLRVYCRRFILKAWGCDDNAASFVGVRHS